MIHYWGNCYFHQDLTDKKWPLACPVGSRLPAHSWPWGAIVAGFQRRFLRIIAAATVPSADGPSGIDGDGSNTNGGYATPTLATVLLTELAESRAPRAITLHAHKIGNHGKLHRRPPARRCRPCSKVENLLNFPCGRVGSPRHERVPGLGQRARSEVQGTRRRRDRPFEPAQVTCPERPTAMEIHAISLAWDTNVA